MSLPSRERGLKCVMIRKPEWAASVAPLAGAWIEIRYDPDDLLAFLSLPSRERGLKSPIWKNLMRSLSRSPRGSVD